MCEQVSMAARIAYSAAFVRRRLHDGRQPAEQPLGLKSLLPAGRTLAVFACAAVACAGSNALLLGGAGQLSSACSPRFRSFISSAAVHIAVGGVCLVACAATVLRTERGLINALRTTRKQRSE